MRYIKPLVCLTACLYLLTSCGGDPEPIETDLSPAQMAAAIINSQDYEQDFIFATPGQDIYYVCVSDSFFRNAGRTWEEPTPPTVDFGDYSRINILQMLAERSS